MGEFKLTRGLLSAYYIAVLISYPLFNLIQDLINSWVTWLVSATKVATGISLQSSGQLWLALFFVCFVITAIIRKFVVQPLGFFINDEGAPTWELWVTLFLVLGAYVYFLNQIFAQPMPKEWPIWLLKLVDGYKNTFFVTSSDSAENQTWVIVPWLWNIAPITFMYVRTRLKPASK